MKGDDIVALGDSIFQSVKGYLGKAVDALSGRMDDFDRRMEAIQVPAKGEDGKDADLAVVAKMVDDAVKALPVPKNGEDGKSVDLVEFSAQIVSAAAKAVDAMYKPKDGIDYDPAVMRTAVADAVKALPPAKPGNDADPELLRAEVARVVAEQVKLLPPAQPGKDADLAVVSKMVADAVALLPKPEKGEDGKSVDLVWLAGQIVAAAGEAIKSMPVPRDGNDYDPDALEAAVKRAVDQIPRPEPGAPGKSVTIDEVAPLVAAEVAKVAAAFKPEKGDRGSDADPVLIAQEVATQVAAAVKALPPAEPGKDADADAIAAAVLEKVLKLLEQIPPPAHGKDADPVLVAQTVRTEVERLWEAMPKPQDGKSVDVVELAGQIAAAAAKAVDAIRKPEDGKDFDPELLKAEVERVMTTAEKGLAESLLAKAAAAIKDQLPTRDEAAERAVIAEVVREQIDELPKPLAGKDADPEQVAAVVAEQLAAAIKALPAPEPGKDADPVVTAKMVADHVAEAFKAVRVPEDGKSVDLVELSGQIVAAAAKAVEAMPKPEPGKSVTAEDVAPLIAAEVSRVAASFTPAKVDLGEGAGLALVADADELLAVVTQAVTDAVAKMEPPPAAEIDTEVLRAEVAKQIADIDLPEPAQPDQDMIRAECERAAQALPKQEGIHPDTVAMMVVKAVDAAIEKIRLPKDGEPGRDVFALEPLPMIDETKSYPRNTYAWHRNGLWHAKVNTDGMQGWFCQINSVFEETEELLPDLRTTVKTTVYSDGAKKVRETKSTATIYRFVFKEGHQYEQGDEVTWAGCTWHCNEPTSEKPAEGKIWTLASKKGRDGASAYDIARRDGFVGSEREWLNSLGGAGKK